MRRLAFAPACLLLIPLAACGSNTTGTACLEDAAGNVLAAGITAAQTPSAVTGQSVQTAATTVLVDAAKDPNCAAAVQTAISGTATPASATPAPSAATPAATSP